MPWFRVDDKSHMNTKVATAGNAAWGLYCRCGAWAADLLTDGYIPVEIARLYGTRTEIARLLTARLWTEVDASPTGPGQFYVMPDFLEYNPSRTEVLADRAAATERQRKAREAARAKRNETPDVTAKSQRDSHRDNSVSHSEVQAQSRSPRPDPTRPDPNTSSSSSDNSSKSLRAVPDDDDENGSDRLIGQVIDHIASRRLQQQRPTNPIAYRAAVLADLHRTERIAVANWAAKHPTLTAQQIADGYEARPELHPGLRPA